MRNNVLLPKRVLKKIGFTAASLALGAFLWASVPQVQAEEGPCWPGSPDFPKCKKDTNTFQSFNTIK